MIEPEHSKISWPRVVIFLIIAITVSNIFRFDVFALQEKLRVLPTWLYILTLVLLEGSGVFIGALLALYFLKKKRPKTITLFGTSRSKSLLMVVIPVFMLTILGVTNEFDLNVHGYGFIAIVGTMLYCIMEEYGWRGYLQEELTSIAPWKKYIAIGIIWYVWHLSFLTEASIGDNLFFLFMMMVGSWGIGQVADSTKSILASACFHLIIQILMFNALIKNGISGTEKLIMLGVCITLWYVIIKKWEKENAAAIAA
jgi:uncharacterized protein